MVFVELIFELSYAVGMVIGEITRVRGLVFPYHLALPLHFAILKSAYINSTVLKNLLSVS